MRPVFYDADLNPGFFYQVQFHEMLFNRLLHFGNGHVVDFQDSEEADMNFTGVADSNLLIEFILAKNAY